MALIRVSVAWDDFNRADTTSGLGSGWTAFNANAMGISSNMAYGVSANFCAALRNDSLNANQWVELSIGALGASGTFRAVHLLLRCSGSYTTTNQNFYRLIIPTTGTNTFEMLKGVSGVETEIQGSTALGATTSAGTIFRFEAEGDNLRCYRNNASTPFHTEIDSDLASGLSGVAVFRNTPRFDNFACGNLEEVEIPADAEEITDDFNRGSLGASWDDMGAGDPLAISSNELAASTTDFCFGRHTTDLSGADQYVEATITARAGATSYFGLFLRIDGSLNAYELEFADDLVRINRYDSGVPTVIAQRVRASSTTVVRFEAYGDLLIGYIGGDQCIAVRDATHTSGRGVGLGLSPVSSATADRFDNFSAGTLGAAALEITPTGIASAEAFGTATLAQQVSATGIASVEAFGTAVLEQQIAPSGIASLEAFGTQTVGIGGQYLSPGSIASAEAFGAQTVGVGGQYLSPSGIASLETFGSPSLPLLVSVAGIASAEVFGDADVDFVDEAQEIFPDGIASLEAFGTPALSYDQQISPDSIETGEDFGEPFVGMDLLTIGPESIPSAEAFGATLFQYDQIIHQYAGIETEEAFGEPSLSQALEISPLSIESAEAFGGHALAGQPLLPSSIASAEAFGSPNIIRGIAIPGIASREEFGAARVRSGYVATYLIDGQDEKLITQGYGSTVLYSDGAGGFFTLGGNA